MLTLKRTAYGLAVFMLFWLSLPPEARGQTKYTFEFNKRLELLKGGAPLLLKPGDRVGIRVAFDTDLFKRQLDSVLVNLFQANIYWTSALKRLKQIKDPDDPEVLGKWETEIQILTGELIGVYNALVNKDIKTLVTNCHCGSLEMHP